MVSCQEVVVRGDAVDGGRTHRDIAGLSASASPTEMDIGHVEATEQMVVRLDPTLARAPRRRCRQGLDGGNVVGEDPRQEVLTAPLLHGVIKEVREDSHG
jgi:hypothetical protein